MKKALFVAFAIICPLVSCTKDNDNKSEPVDKVVEGTYFDTEVKVQDYLKQIYSCADCYISNQNKLDFIRFYNENVESITPNDSLVEITWKQGVECGNKALELINALDGITKPFETTKYVKQAKALRAFVLYNMASEWGYAPIFNHNNSETYEIFDKNKIYELCLNWIDGYDLPLPSYEHESNYISSDAVKVLKAEIYLEQKKSESAYQLLQDVSINTYFELSYVSDNNLTMGGPVIYNSNYIRYLSDEACGIDNSNIWYRSANRNFVKYGVFAALRRLNKIQELTGIDSHYNVSHQLTPYCISRIVFENL